MESAHLHNHHQLHQQFQDQLPLIVASSLSSSSSSLANTTPSPSSCYGVSTSSAHTWTPNNTVLNSGSSLSSLYPNGVTNSILDSRNQQNICNSSMTQDLTFHHWANAAAFGGGGISQTIKQELLSDCYPRFSEVLKAPSTTAIDLQINNHHQQRGLTDMNTIDAKLLLGTLSSGYQPAAQQFYCSTTSSANTNTNTNRGRFSQIYPTINVPSLNQEASLANSSSLGMNMQALDLLNSARLSGSFSHTSPEHQQLGFPNYGIDHHLQQSTQRPFGNVSALFSNATVASEPKRPCNVVEPKPPQAPPKKSRLDSRASCPPFKVRKEKLGDRIAALQQLVAPFGKTDTASVLMEAIGYIKFLQNQVETLSVPYMKSSRNKSSRAMQGGWEENIGSEEARRDLRSRGLCLVPLSCLSYVTESGGGVWPPPSFGGS